MKQQTYGANAGEVAKLPYKLNLQLFAEGEETDAEEHTDGEPSDVQWEPFESDKKSEQSEETPEVAKPEKEPEQPERDLEKDRAFAELRRKAEQAERKANAADNWVKENYGHMGIETWEQYQHALAEEQKRKEYAEKGIDYDEVRKIAQEERDNHPDVIRAKAETQRMSVNAEIRALKSAYPELGIAEVDAIDDLMPTLENLPKWDEISKRVNRGYDLLDAYELVHRDEIMSKRQAAAEQAARNKIKSKDHLKPSSNGEADDAISVPPETMEIYKKMFAKQLKNGTMTMDRIVQQYKRSQKGG